MTLNGIMKASIDRIEVSTRVGMGTSFQYTPYLVKVEDNRAIVEPHCISALQNAFLSDVVLASHFVEDSFMNTISTAGWLRMMYVTRFCEEIRGWEGMEESWREEGLLDEVEERPRCEMSIPEQVVVCFLVSLLDLDAGQTAVALHSKPEEMSRYFGEVVSRKKEREMAMLHSMKRDTMITCVLREKQEEELEEREKALKKQEEELKKRADAMDKKEKELEERQKALDEMENELSESENVSQNENENDSQNEMENNSQDEMENNSQDENENVSQDENENVSQDENENNSQNETSEDAASPESSVHSPRSESGRPAPMMPIPPEVLARMMESDESDSVYGMVSVHDGSESDESPTTQDSSSDGDHDTDASDGDYFYLSDDTSESSHANSPLHIPFSSLDNSLAVWIHRIIEINELPDAVESFISGVEYIFVLLKGALDANPAFCDVSGIQTIVEKLAAIKSLCDESVQYKKQFLGATEEKILKLRAELTRLAVAEGELVVKAASDLLVMLLPAILRVNGPVLSSARSLGALVEPFQLLIDALMNNSPVDTSSCRACELLSPGAVCEIDRYTLAFLALVPRYYVVAIQQAVFAIVNLMKRRAIDPARVADYATLASGEGRLADLIRTVESFKTEEVITIRAGHEDVIVESLLSEGVGTSAWCEA